MTLRPLLLAALLVPTATFVAACSSDDDKSTSTTTPDAGAGPADSGGGGGDPTKLDPYNMDCSSNRWGHFSDACWSCLCDKCADSLNKCNERCVDIQRCAYDKHTYVNVTADIGCEVTLTLGTCMTEEGGVAQASQLVAFDSCLLSATDKAPGEFRACDEACGVTYSGDVCARANGTP